VSADAHKEIVGLDVAVNEIFIMNKLNAADHLIGEHEHRFHCEPPRAEVEQVL